MQQVFKTNEMKCLGGMVHVPSRKFILNVFNFHFGKCAYLVANKLNHTYIETANTSLNGISWLDLETKRSR